MAAADFVPLKQYRGYEPEVMLQRAVYFYKDLSRRRSVRAFSDKPVADQCHPSRGTGCFDLYPEPHGFLKSHTSTTAERKRLYDSRCGSSSKKCDCSRYHKKAIERHQHIYLTMTVR